MIASVHLADVGAASAVKLLRAAPAAGEAPGLRYAEVALVGALSGSLLPRPHPGRVGLIAGWDDDRALEDFLAGHPLAARLAHGWHVRLRPMRVSGTWQRLPGLPAEEERMHDDEPVAVLTLGRLRLSQTVRFLRASAAAEGLALGDAALLASAALARPPGLVATFSLWRSTGAMRAYARGQAGVAHLAAVRADTARAFHHESAFVRFRPYLSVGGWDGWDPLAAVEPEPLSARGV
jgi:hypothetical protein